MKKLTKVSLVIGVLALIGGASNAVEELGQPDTIDKHASAAVLQENANVEPDAEAEVKRLEEERTAEEKRLTEESKRIQEENRAREIQQAEAIRAQEQQNTVTTNNTQNTASQPQNPKESSNLPLKATCKDGTIQYQDTPSLPNYRGMCSHHGGIKVKHGRVP